MWHLVDHCVAGHPTVDDDVAPMLIAALEPTLTIYGVHPARRQQRGPSVVWCSPSDTLQISRGDPGDIPCIDLWVKVDRPTESITAVFEGQDLLRHVTGTEGMFEHPESLALSDSFGESLSVVAELLDRFCAERLIGLGTLGS